ncbi:MAG TPA: hypothetical protein VF446_04200 [Trinickia sp.]
MAHINENLIVASLRSSASPARPCSRVLIPAITDNGIPIQQAKREYTGLGSEVELDFPIESAAPKSIND